MSKQPQIDDKAWLELQVMSAIYNLKEIDPEHPLVVAVRNMIHNSYEEGHQFELQLPSVGLFSKQAE